MSTNLNLWAIPLLPLAGAAINGLLGRRFKNGVVSFVALFFTGASFAWAAWAYRQPIEKQLAMVLGGTGVRLFVVLGGAYALNSSVPYLREHETPGFLAWVLVFYLFTLMLETALSVSSRPAAEPLPAGHTPPPNA